MNLPIKKSKKILPTGKEKDIAREGKQPRQGKRRFEKPTEFTRDAVRLYK